MHVIRYTVFEVLYLNLTKYSEKTSPQPHIGNERSTIIFWEFLQYHGPTDYHSNQSINQSIKTHFHSAIVASESEAHFVGLIQMVWTQIVEWRKNTFYLIIRCRRVSA